MIVTLIALFQLIKAGFFLSAAALLLFAPGALYGAAYDLSWLVALVSADGSAMVATAADMLRGSNPQHLLVSQVVTILLLLGVWLAYLGWGLLRLSSWARKSRIVFSLLQIVMALRVFLIFPGGIDSLELRVALSEAQWRELAVVVVINAAMAFYLLRDLNVVHAFGARDSR